MEEPVLVFDDVLNQGQHKLILDELQRRDAFMPAGSQWTSKSYWHPHDGNVLKTPYTVMPCLPGSYFIRYNELLHTVMNDPRFAEVQKLLKDLEVDRIGVSGFAYPSNSGFDWHHDGENSQLALVYYAVERWEPSWGGELLVDGGDGKGTFVAVRPNRLVIIKRGVNHKVAPISFRAGDQMRWSVAGFFESN
jgi:hypothetical protein